MEMVLYGAELIGTIAFALSGTLLAIKKKLDIFGMLVLSVITALGGGTIRDLILGHTPPRMFYSFEYVGLAMAVTLVVFVGLKVTHRKDVVLSRQMDFLYILCDALGLGIFSVIGTQAGIAAGYGDNAFLCIFLGMLTGVGGGVLRDMMCGDIPGILYRHVYAVAAILGGGVFYVLTHLGVDGTAASLIAMSATVVLRLLAWHYKWNLPRVED